MLRSKFFRHFIMLLYIVALVSLAATLKPGQAGWVGEEPRVPSKHSPPPKKKSNNQKQQQQKNKKKQQLKIQINQKCSIMKTIHQT